jgi:predicted HicB family RNase H-like nuclease
MENEPTKRNSKLWTIRLDSLTITNMNAIAKQRGISASELVRQLIEKAIQEAGK